LTSAAAGQPGISRTSAREAHARLHQDGLVLHMCAVRRRAMAEADRALRSVADHLGIVKVIESGGPGLAARRVMDHTLRLHDHVGRLWRRSAARGAPAKPARTSAGHIEESPA